MTLSVKPFLAFRRVHDLTQENGAARTDFRPVQGGVSFNLYEGFPDLDLQLSSNSAVYHHNPFWYKGVTYSDEMRRGFDCREDLLVPGVFEVEMAPGESLVFSASADGPVNPAGLKRRFTSTIDRIGPISSFRDQLVRSADLFIRDNGGRKQITAGFSWLLTGLLREHLGFNGLIITDATPMVGFNCAMKHADAVPTTIAAGADIFLFNKNLSEDFEYMKDGIRRGLLTRERVDEAVTRILAAKAALGLHEKRMQDEADMACIGCSQHHAWARKLAEDAVTLVKDTEGNLPLNPKKTKRLLLEVLGGAPSEGSIAAYMQDKLAKEGFEVTLYQPEDFSTYQFGVKPFTDQFDAVLYIGNIENASNKTTNRINWFTFWGHGNNVPWFVYEVPTVFCSLANPYHLVDVPMIKTYVNCYSNNTETLDALVEKLMGRDSFRGASPTDPFCGKEYLRY